QVVAAAHQQHAFHVVEGGDGGGDLVKAAALLGGDMQLDDGLDPVGAHLLPVHQGLVTFDVALGGGLVHQGGHFLHRLVQHGGDVLQRQAGVVFQQFQKLFHIRYTPSRSKNLQIRVPISIAQPEAECTCFSQVVGGG